MTNNEPIAVDYKKEYLCLLKSALTASLYEESSWEVIQPTKRIDWDPKKAKNSLGGKVTAAWLRLSQWMLDQLGKKSYLLVKTNKFDPKSRLNGEDHPLFSFTMVGLKRLDNIQLLFEEIIENNTPGDLVETGVWRGGASIFMRALLEIYGQNDRLVWAADSFQGMPKPKEGVPQDEGYDLASDRYLAVSLEQVKENFSKFDLLDDRVKFIPGWFEETLPIAPIEEIALLRLDGDLYESTMVPLVNLYHKVSPGGYVIVDDYYAWPSCSRAIKDFFASSGERPKIVRIDNTAAYWQKPEREQS